MRWLRGIAALLLLAAAAAAGAFFADRPGRVEIVWQGWLIDTSVGVLIAAIALLVVLTAIVMLLAGAAWRLPAALRRRRAVRRRHTGEAALTRGMVALAAGQSAEARRLAARAELLLGDNPIALLLTAEAATRLGDTTAAARAYAALLERPDSEFLGLRGLIGQALRAGDERGALRLAQRARLLRPDAAGLIDNTIVLQARTGDWQGVQQTLASAARRRALPADRLKHHRAVALYELSLAAERRGDLPAAARLAARAQGAAPELPAIACHHGRLLIALGRKRTAARAIERAWRSAPHPQLARLYLDIRQEAGPLARAAALQRLAQQNPDAAESHLAIAEAALTAQLWGEARHHLGRAASATPAGAPPGTPSRRLCLLMAQLEEGESGNAAAAREWLERAIAAPPDPSYICRQCGNESVDWRPLCGECGSFDMLDWRDPAQPQHRAGMPEAIAATPILPSAALPAAPLQRAEALGDGRTIG